MQTNEIHEDLNRAEAAQRLRGIADQIEAGALDQANLTASVPDQLHFELEVDNDEVEIKLNWPNAVSAP